MFTPIDLNLSNLLNGRFSVTTFVVSVLRFPVDGPRFDSGRTKSCRRDGRRSSGLEVTSLSDTATHWEFLSDNGSVPWVYKEGDVAVGQGGASRGPFPREVIRVLETYYNSKEE